MPSELKLLCVFAHPDDESLGTGGLLAKYAAEGVAVSLVCATRGERGWQGPPEANPGLAALGEIRTAELLAAARVLGLREVNFLNYIDGDVDRADPAEIIGRIVAQVRRIRPQVVATFDPYGNYGHPDHIAVSQFTAAALVCAADPAYAGDGQPPHWSITTVIDAEAYWRTGLQAIFCHRSQVADYHLEELPDDVHLALWGRPTLVRVYSLVNGGRQIETDLLAGLR